MNIKQTLNKAFLETFHYLNINLDNINLEFEIPKDKSNGDLSTNIAMLISKELKKNPYTIAEEIVLKLKNLTELNKIQIEVAKPGFINLHIPAEYFKIEVKEILKLKENYLKSDWGKTQTWLIEHTSANPNKAMHFAHLRNNVTAMAISNIWEYQGIKVIRDYIDNNRGIAIAKLMWGYLKFAKKNEKENIVDIKYWYEHKDEWQTPAELNLKPDHFIDKLYVQASEDFLNPEVEKKVRQMVVDWENNDKYNRALWQHVLNYSYLGQQLILDRLMSKIDKIWHEHEIYQQGKDYIQKGLEKGVFKMLEDGAILTDLKDYKLPDTIVLKRDKTSLYITQDLALTKLKRETFKPDKLFWVVGPDQILALKQVFAICEQMGFGKIEDYTHLAHGYITIKGQGKMSSRKGNTIFIDDLLDDVKETIKDKISNENFSEVEKDEIAERVGMAAVKYSILKVGRLTNTEFNFETSLSFEGDSGAYLMYSYTRAKSIIRETGFSENEISKDMLSNTESDLNAEDQIKRIYNTEYEIDLIKHFTQAKFIIQNAARTYSPNLICTYIYELCQKFNKFYINCSVLNADNIYDKNARLELTLAFSLILKYCLNLLGIQTIERM